MIIVRLAGCFFACCGIITLVGSALLYRNTWTLLAHSVRANGSVVDVQVLYTYRHKGRVTYAQVVSFTDAKGTIHEFKASMSRNPLAYQIGQKTTVLYDPVHPETARLGGFADLWMGPLIFGGLGLFFSVVGHGLVIGTSTRNVQSWSRRRDR